MRIIEGIVLFFIISLIVGVIITSIKEANRQHSEYQNMTVEQILDIRYKNCIRTTAIEEIGYCNKFKELK